MDFDAMNPDLAIERRHVQFNAQALTNLLYGGERKVARRREIASFVDSNPIFNDPKDLTFMTREERVKNAARKTAAIFSDKTTFLAESIDEMAYFHNLVLSGDIGPFDLHYIAGLPYIQGQGDEEQLGKWMPQLITRSINVTYAQTELGHGTNLRRLETTATYDPNRQEFIINSPTLSSVKWWSGNLGKSANYAVVMAQLNTQGKWHGLHAFIVPVRDPKTHKLLPGVFLGDIGPKFGMPANDNGFAQFTSVRIPRQNMLMRHSKVLPDGTFVPPVHQKLSYGGMVFIRAMMIASISYSLQRACTIAIRYGCVRRQGQTQQQQEMETKSGSKLPENKVLDYQTQQYRLFPELAKSFAIHFVGVNMRSTYLKISKELHKGDVSNLARLHALSAGLKAVITREAAMGIEICRMSCGGHGYSMACGIAELYADTVAGCTFEGDNIVLLLQTARALIKETKQTDHVSQPQLNPNSSLTLTSLIQVYQVVAKKMTQAASELLGALEKRGYTPEAAWDKCTVELCRIAKAHVRAFIVETFFNVVNDEKLDSSIQRVLTHLCELYAICGIQARAGDFMEHANFTKSQIRELRIRCTQLLELIRPTAVQLVDAFEFHDRELRSVLGRYDGNVYENLFEWAKKSPLNEKEVLTTFPDHLASIMLEGRSKL